jgi:hypothetical protein
MALEASTTAATNKNIRTLNIGATPKKNSKKTAKKQPKEQRI